MVYKRKYQIVGDGKERFLKWKSRLAVVGSSEREGWETVYSTFSPTVAFSDIRLLISLTVDPQYSVESYDLSELFWVQSSGIGLCISGYQGRWDTCW
jgi:hypothetical protein